MSDMNLSLLHNVSALKTLIIGAHNLLLIFMIMLVYWESMVWCIMIASEVVYVKYKKVYKTKPVVLNCHLSRLIQDLRMGGWIWYFHMGQTSVKFLDSVSLQWWYDSRFKIQEALLNHLSSAFT